MGWYFFLLSSAPLQIQIPMSRSFTFPALLLLLVFSLPVAAQQNLALNLNGSNYVLGNQGTELIASDGSSDFTVEFWAYIPAYANDGSNHYFVTAGNVGP